LTSPAVSPSSPQVCYPSSPQVSSPPVTPRFSTPSSPQVSTPSSPQVPSPRSGPRRQLYSPPLTPRFSAPSSPQVCYPSSPQVSSPPLTPRFSTPLSPRVSAPLSTQISSRESDHSLQRQCEALKEELSRARRKISSLQSKMRHLQATEEHIPRPRRFADPARDVGRSTKRARANTTHQQLERVHGNSTKGAATWMKHYPKEAFEALVEASSDCKQLKEQVEGLATRPHTLRTAAKFLRIHWLSSTVYKELRKIDQRFPPYVNATGFLKQLAIPPTERIPFGGRLRDPAWLILLNWAKSLSTWNFFPS
jgi:hypothetical protein